MQENLNVETLQKQFQIVKSETNTSHVMEYGDMVSCDCELILIVVSVEWELVALVTLKPLNILIG